MQQLDSQIINAVCEEEGGKNFRCRFNMKADARKIYRYKNACLEMGIIKG